MADDLKLGVDIEGAEQAARDLGKVVAAADKLKQSTSTAGEELDKSGDKAGDAGKQLDQAAESSNKLLASFGRYAAGAVSISALVRIVTELVRVLDEANQKAMMLSDRAANLNSTVAGAAAQFDVPEDTMRKELANIGMTAGSEDLGALANTSIALSSTGQIGQMGSDGFAPSDRQRIANVQTWLGRTGAGPAAGSVVSAMARIRPYMPDAADTEILGILETAYKQAEATDWSDFLGGMVPTYGQMAQGYDPVQAISEYASLAKYTPSGDVAGDTIRQISDLVIFSGKEKIVNTFDEYMGQSGTYERMLKNDRAGLSTAMQSMFAQVSDMDRIRLYERAGLEFGDRTRMNNLLAGRSVAVGIRDALTGVDAAEANQRWLSEPTAKLHSANAAAMMISTENTEGMTDFAVAAKIAEAERERMAVSNPWRKTAYEVFGIGNAAEQSGFLRHRISQVLARHGVDADDFYGSLPQSGNFLTGYNIQDDYAWLSDAGIKPGSNFDFDFVEDASLRRDLQTAVGKPGVIYNGGTHYHQHDKSDPAAVSEPMWGAR